MCRWDRCCGSRRRPGGTLLRFALVCGASGASGLNQRQNDRRGSGHAAACCGDASLLFDEKPLHRRLFGSAATRAHRQSESDKGRATDNPAKVRTIHHSAPIPIPTTLEASGPLPCVCHRVLIPCTSVCDLSHARLPRVSSTSPVHADEVLIHPPVRGCAGAYEEGRRPPTFAGEHRPSSSNAAQC